MVPSKLVQVQLDLRLHRSWLTSFLHGAHPVTASYRSTALRSRVNDLHPHLTRTTCRESSTFKARRKSRNGPEIVYIKTFENRDTWQAQNQLEELGIATRDVRIEKVVQLYAAIENKTILETSGFRNIAQCLHQALRSSNQLEKDAERRRAHEEFLLSFAETLVADVMRGTLEPHCRAHMHLLGFFKESGARDAGVRFWKWLEGRDELHVDADVYGAAIELLAVNGSPLVEMEDLYRQGLSTCQAAFMDYHLLPEAIVPNREQMTTLKGVPMSLLQGILTARLLHGDSTNAYLALDTALRLYPDQVPQRFFQLFMEERPLQEAYTVFAMACRAGTSLPLSFSKQLVSAVRLRLGGNLSSPVRHGFAVRSMLSTLYAYMCARGEITNNSVAELVIAMTQFLRLKGVANLPIKDRQMLVNEVTKAIGTVLEIFARRGATPRLSAFNSIITNLGGYGHSKQVIGVALEDALALGLQPNSVTYRSIMTAAGTLRDGAFLKEAWSSLLDARANAGQDPDRLDFHVFVQNAAAIGLLSFAREEVARLQKTLSDNDRESISAALDNPPGDSTDATVVDESQILEELRKIRLDLEVMGELTKSGSQVQDLRRAPFPISLVPVEELLPEIEMRRLYDELTTNQSLTVQSAVNADTVAQNLASEEENETQRNIDVLPAAISSTNIPFGTLRYENWKTINHLLAQAEVSDKAYIDAVDEAIAAGKVPPRRQLGLRLPQDGEMASFGLSDTINSAPQTEGKKDEEGQMTDSMRIQEGRARILRLRGRDAM